MKKTFARKDMAENPVAISWTRRYNEGIYWLFCVSVFAGGKIDSQLLD